MLYKVALIVGARPNFMKAAPLIREFSKFNHKYHPILIHTGQHYDYSMSNLFFKDLDLPKPDFNLDVGSDTHGAQTARIMMKLEAMFMEDRPDLIIVFGDVNSTLAAALVASKLHIKVGHVEAGLRSFDKTMPEEVNRLLTDHVSDHLFVSEPVGLENLKKEGIGPDGVVFVGNIMIDVLIQNMEKCQRSVILEKLSLKPRDYAVVTLHRPSNVDNPEILKLLLETISGACNELPVVFPCHPRTRETIKKYNILTDELSDSILFIDPLGYLDFLSLQSQSLFVTTDSGGIQAETTFLGIPCITLRDTTESLITVTEGTNTLTGLDPSNIHDAISRVMRNEGKKGVIPRFWDGKTSERIVSYLNDNI
jgi:UDP-N-acetylglucosamine 2-epimerase (non-hydrolysing)